MADIDLDPYQELGLSDKPNASDADIRQVCVHGHALRAAQGASGQEDHAAAG
jgi:hypothetical protein